MPQLGRWLLVLLLGSTGIFWLVESVNILRSGSLAFRPTTVSIDALSTGGFPENGYLEITDGYLVISPYENFYPFFFEEERDRPCSAYLVAAPALAEWNETGPQGQRANSLLTILEINQVAQIWPQTSAIKTTLNGRDFAPVQMTVVGEVEIFVPSHIPGSKSLSAEILESISKPVRVFRYSQHPNSPWQLLVSMAFVISSFSIIVYLLSRPRSSDANRPPICDGESFPPAAVKHQV